VHRQTSSVPDATDDEAENPEDADRRKAEADHARSGTIDEQDVVPSCGDRDRPEGRSPSMRTVQPG
jgi:hypothetical protein